MWDDGWFRHEFMGWGDGASPWLFMGLHGLFWLLIVGVAVTALVLLIRGSGRGASPAENDSAVAVLKSRYARGEIDRGEYLERRGDLS